MMTSDIQKAAAKAGVQLTVDQACQLLNDGHTDVRPEQVATCKAVGRCEGIKIHDFGNGCGLYYHPPFSVSYCCEF